MNNVMDLVRCFDSYGSSAIARYFDALSKSSGDYIAKEAMEYCYLKRSAGHGEFELTVAIRTQGTRPDELSDVLSCLYAQEDDCFEILIVCHNCQETDAERLVSTVNNMPSEFSDRVNIVLANGGGRSRPLNVALHLTQTSYLAFLDDDDLVFTNWVSSFKESMRSNTGRIIHSFTYTQPWVRVYGQRGITLAATGPSEPTFFSTFDYVTQVQINTCPIMSVAFPIKLLKCFDLFFDETLSTVEDWDFLMRAAQICGVTETFQGTSIYRLWESGETSHRLHDEVEWEQNRQYVQEKLSKLLLLIPGDSLLFSSDELKVDCPVRLVSDYQKLYFDDCLTDDSMRKPASSEYDKRNFFNTICYECDGHAARRISFQLKRRGQFKIDSVHILAICCDGTKYEFTASDVKSTAYELSPGELSFIRDNSVMTIQLPKKSKIDRIELSFRYFDYINPDLLSGTKILVRIRQWIMRHLRK